MKNKLKFIKINWFWITIGLLVTILIILVGQNWNRNIQHIPEICGDNQCFLVELAKTPEERQKGLMYRKYMAENNGMLFIFNHSDIYNFWMKDTRIPLDILWIDENFKIVKVLTAEPCITDPCPTYQPGIPATYVLEINAGLAAKYGITEGMKMKFVNIYF